MTIGRSYLFPGEIYEPTAPGLPLGVILLDRFQVGRNLALCRAFVGGIERTETIAEQQPEARIVATFWPLITRTANAVDLGDCEFLLANYDYRRSDTVRKAYGRENTGGPIILALQLNGTEAADAMVLDLGAASGQEIARTTTDWFSVAYRQQSGRAATPVKANSFTNWLDNALKNVRGNATLAKVGDGLVGEAPYRDPYHENARGTLVTSSYANGTVSLTRGSFSR
ncbi:hypothetical protein ACFCW2_12745 [Qipengyuania sp. DSG2-2]|uniref:hypothetical protein n=1 Tax=Qipengyuania sp. DGS2-2 TaxID=3349631 RepID=UPI0036D26683